MNIQLPESFDQSDPFTRMDMLLMALRRAGYQLQGKPMPSWGCEPTTRLSPYQCGNNWVPLINNLKESVSTHIRDVLAPTQEPYGDALLTPEQREKLIREVNAASTQDQAKAGGQIRS